MAFTAKSFHSRNHVPGQLVGAAELLEMQSLQQITQCNIDADRFGLNDDGTFTPHVIAGLKPTIVTGAQKIRISRGHGWVVNAAAGFNNDRRPIVLDSSIEVDIPSGDATHPRWVHVCLYNPTAGQGSTYGSATQLIKNSDNQLVSSTFDLYKKLVVSEAVLVEGTAAASPECPIISNPSFLPIATVYIPAGFSGEIVASNLCDVRWFGVGNASTRWSGDTGTAIGPVSSTRSSVAAETAKTTDGTYILSIVTPSRGVFPLLPEYERIESAYFETATGLTLELSRLESGVFDSLTSPQNNLNIIARTYNGATLTDLGAGDILVISCQVGLI